MSRDPTRAATQFFGGRVCLDFANTLDWRTSADPQELIPDYESLLAWSVRRDTMAPKLAARLTALARAEPSRASRTLGEALSLRAQIWKIADALRQNGSVDLKALNALIASLPPQPALLEQAGAYLHDLPADDLRAPLWPVLWSLTAVLTSTDAARIGCCQADGCGWYYVDESPNRTRQWCSSAVCGNRERVRRAYAKSRKKRSQGRRGKREV